MMKTSTEKAKEQKNKNTERSDKRAHTAFTKYLQAYGLEGEELEYWKFEASKLDTYLAKFWFGARKDVEDFSDDNEDFEPDPALKDKCYSANTIRNFRYALNRILKEKSDVRDIIEKGSKTFKKSQEAFTNAVKELKSQGKAEIHSKHEITEDGKRHIYLGQTASRQLFANF